MVVESVERLDVLVSIEASSIGPIPPSCRSDSDSLGLCGFETLDGRLCSALDGESTPLVTGAGNVEGAGCGAEGSIANPDCTGLNPSDTIPANASKSSSPPPMEIRTEFLVEILRSNSLLLVLLGSIVAVVAIQAEGAGRARSQQHHQRWIDGRWRPGEVIDGWRCVSRAEQRVRLGGVTQCRRGRRRLAFVRMAS